METIDGIISVAPSPCREIFSQFVCRSIFFSCGTEGNLHIPVSVCPDGCAAVEEACTGLWELLEDELRLDEDNLTDCSKIGSILSPLPYCCEEIVLETDSGTKLPEIIFIFYMPTNM